MPRTPFAAQAAMAAVLACAITPPLATAAERTYAGLEGTVLLDNERVHVERFVLAPRAASGTHLASGDQLLVFIRGGLLRSGGRTVDWKDGRVAWSSTARSTDEGVTNAGTQPVEFLWVTLNPGASATAHAAEDVHLNYPNIPGEDLLENDRLVVQRFLVQPGQWEGVHAHRPGMLYIHVRGGQWAARSKHEPEHVYPTPSPDGEIGWMTPVGIEEGHESGNVGPKPIDLIWVTLKP
jgi:quercetin dioxygenase-like cupin family protein